jgi:Na+-driven multidrug efflux pump
MGVIGMRKLIRMQPKMEIYMSSNGVGRIIFLSSFYLGLTLALLLQVGTWTNRLLVLFTEYPATRASLGRILPLIVLTQPINALVFAADRVLHGAVEFPFP